MFERSKLLKECGDIEEEIAYDSNNIRISSDPTLFGDDFIIKIYQFGKDGRTINGIARVSMKEPIYIECDCHNDYLSKENIIEFMSALSGPRISKTIFYNDNEFPNNVWEKVIVDSNRVYIDSDIHKRIPLDLPIPDYSLLPIQS